VYSGKTIHPDGTVYQGSYELDYRSGPGELRTPTGLVYEATFAKDRILDGHCVCFYPDGNKYDGLMQAGVPHGDGSMQYRNGNRLG